MTGGWTADARTLRFWRFCEHPDLLNGRCIDCRAKPWPDFTQPPRSRVSAVPIGSALIVTPRIVGPGGLVEKGA